MVIPGKRGRRRAALLLLDRVKRVFRELPGALAGMEEPVHQVRVAGRRLRVALPLLASRRGRRLTRALRVLRQLTREVGAGRDLDVFLGLLEDHVETAPVEARAERRRLVSRLRALRLRARSSVADAVLDLDIDGMRRNLRRVLRRGAAPSAEVLERAAAQRAAQGALLLRGFSEIGELFRPVALHVLRRRVRRLRYAAEIEDALREQESRAPVLWKRLQDAIGTLHDHHLLAEWLAAQVRAAELRGNLELARAARAERRHFVAEARRLHGAFLAMRPADLALRALEAGNARRGRRAASGQDGTGGRQRREARHAAADRAPRDRRAEGDARRGGRGAPVDGRGEEALQEGSARDREAGRSA